MRKRILECIAVAALGATLAAGAFAQQNRAAAKPAKASKSAPTERNHRSCLSAGPRAARDRAPEGGKRPSRGRQVDGLHGGGFL